MTVQGGDGAAKGPYPALKLTFKGDEASGPAADSSKKAGAGKEIVAVPYRPPNPGPYPQDQPQRNAVRFTPVQVGGCADASLSGSVDGFDGLDRLGRRPPTDDRLTRIP